MSANVTNSFVVMKPGQAVGEAVEADSLPKIQDTASQETDAVPGPVSDEHNPDTSSASGLADDPFANVLAHLRDMLKLSKRELTEEQFSKLGDLIW